MGRPPEPPDDADRDRWDDDTERIPRVPPDDDQPRYDESAYDETAYTPEGMHGQRVIVRHR